MTSTTSFKGQYKGFQISLQLNSSNVLQFQAVKGLERYAQAIDKTYLLEHTQFFNLIDEPRQILQYFNKQFSKVVFEGGQLRFAYGSCNPELITILLQREPALNDIRQELAKHTEQIRQLDCYNLLQDNKISNLQETVKKLSLQITSLQTKDNDIDKEISGLKAIDHQLGCSIQATNYKLGQLQIQVSSLKLKDSNIDIKIAQLEVKDKKFDQNLKALAERQEKLTRRFIEADIRLALQLKDLQEKYQRLCLVIGNLKITDVIIQEQIRVLTCLQEKDRLFQCQITKRVDELEQNLFKTNLNLNAQVKKLNAKDVQIECQLNQKIKKLDQDLHNDINCINLVFNQKIARINHQIANINDSIVCINAKFTEVDVQIQAQLDEFKKQQARINDKLLKADQELKCQIQQIRQEFRKSIDYLRCYIDEQDCKLEKKINNVNIELSTRITTQCKRNDQQDVEIAKLQLADKQINQSIAKLRIYVDERIEKLRKELSADFERRLMQVHKSLNSDIKKVQNSVHALTREVQNLWKEFQKLKVDLTNKDREIDVKIEKLQIYHSELTKLLQKLVCTDISINKEIEQLKKRQDQETQSVKKEIECIKQQICQIQKTDCIQDKKIENLEHKDNQIICIIENSVKDLNVKINAKVDITEFNKKITQIESKLSTQIALLKKEDINIRAQFSKDVQQLQEKICTKASITEVDDKFNTLNNKINDLERRLNLQISTRESKDISIVCLIREVQAALKKEINTKANACDVVFKPEFDKKVQEFTKKDKQIQQQIASLDTKLSASINILQVQVKANTADIKKIYLLFNWPYLRCIQYEDKLGNHPANLNKNSIVTQRLHYNVLLVKKTTTKQGAYNFVNIYEINRFSKARYVLKIVKANYVFAFIAFSTDICLKNQYIENYTENYQDLKHVNEEGRNGYGFTLNTGDQIECLADLFSNTLSFTLLTNKNKAALTSNVPITTAGKGLYLQVASEAALEFEVIIQ